MFVAVFLSDADFIGTINWEWLLDASQVLGLTLTIYLFIVYIPLLVYGEGVVSPIEDRLLLWRNILLTGGLVARVLSSGSGNVRRLYLPPSLRFFQICASLLTLVPAILPRKDPLPSRCLMATHRTIV